RAAAAPRAALQPVEGGARADGDHADDHRGDSYHLGTSRRIGDDTRQCAASRLSYSPSLSAFPLSFARTFSRRARARSRSRTRSSTTKIIARIATSARATSRATNV